MGALGRDRQEQAAGDDTRRLADALMRRTRSRGPVSQPRAKLPPLDTRHCGARILSTYTPSR